MATYEDILKQASQRGANPYSFKKTFPAYIVLVIALIASFFVWGIVEDTIEADNSATFEKAYTSVQNRIEGGVQQHLQIVGQMQELYRTSPFIVRDVFELYGSIPAEGLESVLSVSYVPAIPTEELSLHTYYARSERYYDYAIFPDSVDAEIHYPVYYVVPLERNLSILGFNMASDSALNSTIVEAEGTGAIAATNFFDVRPDTLGFMFVAPVSKVDDASSSSGIRNLKSEGVVALEILAQEFFDASLGNSVASDTAVVFTIFDELADGTNNVVYTSKNSEKVGDYSAMLSDTIHINVANKDIVLDIRTVPNFGGEFQNNIPILSLVGSLVTSVLIFLFTLSLLTSRARAEDLAERTTRSQRRIVDTSQDMIGITSIDGVWTTMNPASISNLGILPDDIIGTSFYDQVIPEERDRVRELLQSTGDEQTCSFEVQMTNQDGSIRWVSWNSVVSHTEGFMYNIGRDITEQKKAEERIKLQSKQVALARQFTEESTRFKSQFMENASFYFRTSLTGIIGYLQLVKNRLFTNDEEHDQFIEVAYQSSEDLLSRVSDLLDVAEGEEQEQLHQEEHSSPIHSTINTTIEYIQNSLLDRELTFDVQNSATDEFLFTLDEEQFKDMLLEAVSTFTQGQKESTIQAFAQVNPFESVIEIQVLFASNDEVTSMIELYKGVTDDQELIELLKSDKDDIIFRMAELTSRVKMEQGTMVIESMGSDGNVIMLTLPAKRSSNFSFPGS